MDIYRTTVVIIGHSKFIACQC